MSGENNNLTNNNVNAETVNLDALIEETKTYSQKEWNQNANKGPKGKNVELPLLKNRVSELNTGFINYNTVEEERPRTPIKPIVRSIVPSAPSKPSRKDPENNNSENEFNFGAAAKRRKTGATGSFVPLSSKGVPKKSARRKVGGKRKTRKAKKSRKH